MRHSHGGPSRETPPCSTKVRENPPSPTQLLRDARERSVAETEAETDKKLLNHSQQQASFVVAHADEFRAHTAERLTTYGSRKLAASEKAQKDLREINRMISDELASKTETSEKVFNDFSRL